MEVPKLKNLLSFFQNRNKKVQPPRKIIKSLPRNTETIPPAALQYLTEVRGLTPKEIRSNHLRYAIDRSGLYSNSIIFPIIDLENHIDVAVEYFVCRKLPAIMGNSLATAYPFEHEPKYVNAPWDKGKTLYQPAYFGPWNRPVCIVEGVLDAIRVARVSPVVALLGKQANSYQIERLKDSNDDYIIMLDSDAYLNAIVLRTVLGRGRICFLPQGKDPGSMTEVEIETSLVNP